MKTIGYSIFEVKFKAAFTPFKNFGAGYYVRAKNEATAIQKAINEFISDYPHQLRLIEQVKVQHLTHFKDIII